jgi:hypothetical protein
VKTVLIFVFSTLAACAALALPAQGGWTLEQDLGAEENFLGVSLNTILAWTCPTPLGNGPLLDAANFKLSAENSLSPSYEQFGLTVDIAPLAVFDVALTANAITYYSALGYGFYNLGSYSAAFSAAALASLSQGESSGFNFQIKPTLKYAIGRVDLLDSVTFDWVMVNTSTGYFYDRFNCVILAANDLEITNNAYVLYDFGNGVLAGLTDAHLVVHGSGYQQNWISGIGIWRTSLSPRLDLSAALQAGYWLEDKYLNGVRFAGQVGVKWRI